MPVPVVCPNCSAKLNAPDSAAGKKVKCPKCQGVITVPAPLPVQPAFEVVDDPEPPKKKPLAKVKADVVVDDDEQPRKKRRVADDEGDEDDRPRKKKKKQREGDNSAMIRNIVGVAVLVPLLGVAAYIFYDRYKDKKDEDKPSGDSPSAKSGGTGGPPTKMMPLPGGPAAVGGNPAGNTPVVPGGRKQPQAIGTPGQPATLTSPSGFKVTFPGQYASTENDVPPPLKEAIGLPIRLYATTDHSVGWECVAASVDLPAGATEAQKKEAYDKVVKTIVEEGGKKVEVLSRQTVMAGGREWEEFTVRGEKSDGIVRLLQTDSHIYLLLVAHDKGKLPTEGVKKFFDSFELTK
jgi:hypothetical protein